jgi:hypothetical protein
MRENAFIVASLLTRSRDPALFLRHPSVYSCCLATTRRSDATRWVTRSRFGSARLCSALLGTARRKHRFVHYCVIAGACFDVTVLVCRKYATISMNGCSNKCGKYDVQGSDKKKWQHRYSSEITLLPEVNTLTFLQYNRPPPRCTSFCQICGRRRTPSARPLLSMSSSDRPTARKPPLSSPAAKEILDSVSSMSPCIVMKDDGVRCQQVSSLSPECWTKMITQEIAVHLQFVSRSVVLVS